MGCSSNLQTLHAPNWNGLLETNTLTYSAHSQITVMPSLITLANGFSRKYLTRQKRLARDERRKSYWRGRLPTVNLPVLTSLNKLPFILKYYLLFTKQATLKRSTLLSLPLQTIFLGQRYYLFEWRRKRFTTLTPGGRCRPRRWCSRQCQARRWCWDPLARSAIRRKAKNNAYVVKDMLACSESKLICRSPRLTFVEKTRRLVRARKGH